MLTGIRQVRHKLFVEALPRKYIHTCQMNMELSFNSSGYRVAIDDPMFYEIIAMSPGSMLLRIVSDEDFSCGMVCTCCGQQGQPPLYHLLPDAVVLHSFSVDIVNSDQL